MVTDFDQTISSFLLNGEANPATFSIFRLSNHVPTWFIKGMKGLYLKYSPIEVSTSIGFKEKQIHLKEWYDQVNELF